jgi:hypothetical protein
MSVAIIGGTALRYTQFAQFDYGFRAAFEQRTFIVGEWTVGLGE